MYAKLQDTILIRAPKNVEYKGAWYFPAPDNVLEALGYKILVETRYPEDGKHYIATYEDRETAIVRVWVETEPPAPIDPWDDNIKLMADIVDAVEDEFNAAYGDEINE